MVARLLLNPLISQFTAEDPRREPRCPCGNLNCFLSGAICEDSSDEASRWDQREIEDGPKGRLSSGVLGKMRMESRYVKVLQLGYNILCRSGVAILTKAGEEAAEAVLGQGRPEPGFRRGR